MKKKKVSEKENEWKGVLQETKIPNFITDYKSSDCTANFHQVTESNVTPDSLSVTSTNGSDYNAGVNLDWDKKIKHDTVYFEFTPKRFWQLIFSVAINLYHKEIELSWLCFRMYISYEKNE